MRMTLYLASANLGKLRELTALAAEGFRLEPLPKVQPSACLR